MSQLDEKAASRDEVIAWIQRRIEELETELRMLRSILAHYEERGRLSPDEKVEEVKVGRRRIARLYIGDTYVRLVPDFDMPLPSDLRDYLEETVEEIRSRQAREGVDDSEKARLVVRESAMGGVREVMIANIEGIAEMLKAKAALKYITEFAWEIAKARQAD